MTATTNAVTGETLLGGSGSARAEGGGGISGSRSRPCCLCLFFPAFGELLIAIVSLSIISFVVFWVARDGLTSYLHGIGPQASGKTVRQTAKSVVFQVEGFDKAGRRGVFDIVVLKKEFLWSRGSSDRLERSGKTIPLADLAATVIDGETHATLQSARDIIAAGTASQEGTPAEEVARAGRRAVQTAKLILPAAPETTPVWTLNLGQYRDPCEDCDQAATSWQRPFIVITAVEKDDGLAVAEALKDAMSGREKLPSPRRYSNFDLKRYR